MNELVCTDGRKQCEHPERCCHDCSDKHDCTETKCLDVPRSCGRMTDPTAKDTAGKPRLALVSPLAIEAIGIVRTYGTEKYGGDPDNWRQVPAAYYRDALMRHWCKYLRDPKAVDSESGLPHLWHVLCNASFLVEMEASRD